MKKKKENIREKQLNKDATKFILLLDKGTETVQNDNL